jgi:hypothetical protein
VLIIEILSVRGGVTAIIFNAIEDHSQRETVFRVLKRISQVKKLKVLDLGGGAGSWLGDLVTHIVDLQPNEVASALGIEVVIGDAHSQKVFERFEDNFFDFVSCTHTLEDVRDPGQIISHINRISKAGFIATPNRHQELSNLESPFWRGNLHHRWIFSIYEGSYWGAFKSGVVTSSGGRYFQLIQRVVEPLKIKRLSLAVNNLRPTIQRDWWNRKISTYRPKGPELSFFYFGEIPFKYFMDDLGSNPGEMPLHHAEH